MTDGYVIWINGKRYDDRSEMQHVGWLRELGGIPDDHDLFAEGAPGEQDVRLPRDPDNSLEDVPLSRWTRFYSTPRFING